MKKAIIVILVILAVVLFIGSKNDFEFGGITSSYVYSNADRYTAGGGKINADVAKIDLSWIDGKAEFVHHDGDNILISEKAEKLDTDKQLHWLVDGDTLYIKYAASGFKTGKNMNKTLTVSLPKDIALDKLIMNVVSTDVKVQELATEHISIQTVSGDVEGSIKQVEEAAINTVSGSVSMAVGEAESVSVSTVSGNAAFRFESAPKKITADSVSGNVIIYLPEDAGFYAKMDSVSGDVSGDLPMEMKDKETYVSGDESCRISINTVSGDAKLEKMQE